MYLYPSLLRRNYPCSQCSAKQQRMGPSDLRACHATLDIALSQKLTRSLRHCTLVFSSHPCPVYPMARFEDYGSDFRKANLNQVAKCVFPYLSSLKLFTYIRTRHFTLSKWYDACIVSHGLDMGGTSM